MKTIDGMRPIQRKDQVIDLNMSICSNIPLKLFLWQL